MVLFKRIKVFSNMLKKIFRITKRKEFEKIYKFGRSRFSDIVRVKSLSNKLPYSRFAIVVSTKVSKKATERNLIKRRISAFLSLRINEIKPSLDIVLMVLPEWKKNKITKNKEILQERFKSWQFVNN
jgi:ribonuclease P protein component